MDKLLVALVSCCLLFGVTSVQSFPQIQKCSVKDTNFDTCVLNSAKQALPHIIKGDGEHLIPILDPLFASRITVTDGKVEVQYKNVLIGGFKNFDLESIRFDLNNQTITFEGKLPVLTFKGDYETKGYVLGRRIDGQGPFHISYYDTSLKYTTTYTLYQHDDGQTYLVLKEYQLYLVPANVTFEMGNLFNGNKVLGGEMNKFLSDNMGTALRDIGPKVFDSIGLIIHRIFSHATTTVPYKKLFEDTE